jgi:hypothetical protein
MTNGVLVKGIDEWFDEYYIDLVVVLDQMLQQPSRMAGLILQVGQSVMVIR